MNKSNITFDRLNTFVRVAERGSLSAVSKDIGIGQSTISRHLSELENTLGVILLNRTTRSVTLTDEGNLYYAKALQILALVEQATEEIQNAHIAPTGNIKVSCTAALGVLHITEMILAFQEIYPDISIDLSLNDEQINLVEEGVDIALRLGPLSDSSMLRKSLGLSHRVLVASPKYIEKHGLPLHPSDLTNHEFVLMRNVIGSNSLSLRSKNNEIHNISVKGRLGVDHGLAVRQAILAHKGMALTHEWLVDDLIKQKALQVILPEYIAQTVAFNMLIIPKHAHIKRIRLLIDFLAEKSTRIPGIR